MVRMPLRNAAGVTDAPTFVDSPSIPWFGHLIPEDGIVDAVDVKINWNSAYPGGENDDGVVLYSPRIKDVAVIFSPRRLFDGSDHPLVDMTNYLDDRYFYYTHGNVFTDWSEWDFIEQLNAIWDDYCYYGFLNDDEAIRARLEFARIRECEWARDPNMETPKGSPWSAEDYHALSEKRAAAKAKKALARTEPESLTDIEQYSVAAWLKKDIPPHKTSE
jgi:hypothetical protein